LLAFGSLPEVIPDGSGREHQNIDVWHVQALAQISYGLMYSRACLAPEVAHQYGDPYLPVVRFSEHAPNVVDARQARGQEAADQASLSGR